MRRMKRASWLAGLIIPAALGYGARGAGKAIYMMDPNEHLIELRYYPET